MTVGQVLHFVMVVVLTYTRIPCIVSIRHYDYHYNTKIYSDHPNISLTVVIEKQHHLRFSSEVVHHVIEIVWSLYFSKLHFLHKEEDTFANTSQIVLVSQLLRTVFNVYLPPLITWGWALRSKYLMCV